MHYYLLDYHCVNRCLIDRYYRNGLDSCGVEFVTGIDIISVEKGAHHMEMMALLAGIVGALVAMGYWGWRGRGLIFAISMELLTYSAHRLLGPTMAFAIMTVVIPVLYIGPWACDKIASAIRNMEVYLAGKDDEEYAALCTALAESQTTMM